MSNILLIEDDELYRDMLLEMLQREGHSVDVAGDGQEGLAKLQGKSVDLVITDILMPNMDGIETIMALVKAKSNMPVIAMSGGRRSISPAFNLESARLMGVKATLTKPFTRAQLKDALSVALG
ncbi:response regulator [Limnobacter sp.]|uniref:response regulator n=1 Tax=Limnobacter sp. TaxID=2003368 RepID=UPI0035190C55